MNDPISKKLHENVGTELKKIIHSLTPNPQSILEAGIGEGNTLSHLLQHFETPIVSYGFDISWSRIAYARNWLKSQNCKNTVLFTGDLLNIPCADNAFDIVYTAHAIEPNRGKEQPILQELFRVAKKYLILLEPSYELASEESKQRMDEHGYIKGLEETALKLEYNVVEYKLFKYTANPLNPTAIMIIQKNSTTSEPSFILADPQFKTPLQEKNNVLFSPDSLKVYPIIDGIPCLRIENGIVASKYAEFVH
ncbi:MAG: methyltransferase domain-containing protein [Planctomycetaceae bacterium]|nr:methyltransferase domain-containing protein [Planctomycetaceae bacterium]